MVNKPTVVNTIVILFWVLSFLNVMGYCILPSGKQSKQNNIPVKKIGDSTFFDTQKVAMPKKKYANY